MRLKKNTVLIIIFVIFGFVLYSFGQNIHYAANVASAAPAKSQAAKKIPYGNYKKNAGWEMGSSFSDLLPQLKKMKYELPEDDEQYDNLIAFYDKNQRLLFESGILTEVVTTQKGKGISNVIVVGDSYKKLLQSLGKPLVKMPTDGGIYYGYGTSYNDQELSIKISNHKVVEIILQTWEKGTPDENRSVLAYLNSIGDPAANYYVCNACEFENNSN